MLNGQLYKRDRSILEFTPQRITAVICTGGGL